jgi:hypothetical protein
MPHIFSSGPECMPHAKTPVGAASINAYEVGLVPLTFWRAIRRDNGRDIAPDMGLKSAVKTGC